MDDTGDSVIPSQPSPHQEQAGIEPNNTDLTQLNENENENESSITDAENKFQKAIAAWKSRTGSIRCVDLANPPDPQQLILHI